MMRNLSFWLLLNAVLSCSGLICHQESITLNSDGTLALSSTDFLTTWSSQGSVASSICGSSIDKCILMAFVEDSGGTQTLKVSGRCYDPSESLFYSKGISCGNSTSVGFAFDGTYAYSCCDTDSCNDQALYTAVETDLTGSFMPNCSTPEARECVEKYEEAYGCHQTSLRPPASEPCSKYVWGAGYSCLHQKCTCDCSGIQSLTEEGMKDLSICQQTLCVSHKGFCAPGCNHSQVNDGTCDVMCMNEDCYFDGGDCLESKLSGFAIRSELFSVDSNYDMLISKSEYDTLASSSSFFPALTQMEYDAIENETGSVGLGLRQLAVAVMSDGQDLRSQLVGSQATDKQVAHLELAVLLVGLADSDQDGMLSAGEAAAMYGIDRHQFTYLNSLDPDSALTADEIAAMLRRVTETLGGHTWPLDAGFGIDVTTTSLIKFADYGRDGHMSKSEASGLSLPTAGFHRLDLNDDAQVSPDELEEVVRFHSEHPCHALQSINETSGEISARVPVPGFGPSMCQFLIMPHWHHLQKFDQSARASCPHVQGAVDLRSSKRRPTKKSRKTILPQQDFEALRWSPGRQETRHRLSDFVQGRVSKDHSLTSRTMASKEKRTRRLQSLKGSINHIREIQRVANSKEPHLRVVAGEPAEYMQFPFAVSLEEASCGVNGFLTDAIWKGFDDFRDSLNQMASNESRLVCSHSAYMYLDLVMMSADFNRDGFLVADEACLTEAVFKSYAANHSNVDELSISRAALETLITEWLVSTLDSNADGVLSSAEAPMSSIVFDFLVGSGNTLTAESLKTNLRVLRQLYPVDIREHDVVDTIEQNDLNKNGILEYQEAPELFMAMGMLSNETVVAADIADFISQVNLTSEVQDMAGCAFPPTPNPISNTSHLARRLLSIHQGNGRNLLQTMSDTVWTHYCGGTLIHPRWILTAASCVASYQRVRNTQRAILGGHFLNGSRVEGLNDDEGCDSEEAYFSRVVIHPAFVAGDTSFDVALIELEDAVSFPPVRLHDGGDIDHLECKKLNLTAIGWGQGNDGTQILQHVQLDSTERQDCSDEYYMKYGYRAVSPQEHTLCAGQPGMGPCHGDTGGPLLVKYKEDATGWLQVGVTNGGVSCGDSNLPGIYTRVSAVYPWILAVSALGSPPAKRIRLVVDRLMLPSSIELAAYSSGGQEDFNQIIELDTKCEAGTVIEDHGSGVLLLALKESDMSGSSSACSEGCLSGANFQATFRILGCAQNFMEQIRDDIGACESTSEGNQTTSTGIEGCVYDRASMQCSDPACILERKMLFGSVEKSVIYQDVVEMEAVGKSFSGSLGARRGSIDGQGQYESWVCVRDWNPDQQRGCALQRGELGCFVYDESTSVFHYYGRNSEVRLVAESEYEDGVHREFRSISHLP